LNQIGVHGDKLSATASAAVHRDIIMIEFLVSVVVFILRAAYVVLEIVGFVLEIVHVVGWRKDKSVEVPPDPKTLPPAAQRALDEAEQRRFESVAAKN
jgi:hypothetical protein